MNLTRFTNKIKNFLSGNIISALLTALFPAIIVILIEPINFQKYKIELNQTRTSNKGIDFYRDADKNGDYELYRLVKNSAGKLALKVYDKFLSNIYQENSKYYLPKDCEDPSVFFDDVNNDASEDIIYLSQNKDSLFLNIFSYKGFKPIVKDRFVTTVGLNGKHDYRYKWITAKDVNNDNRKEIFFSITGSFSLYPRKNFRYDFKNDSLISSENTGAKQRTSYFPDNGEDLFLLSVSGATNNCIGNFPYKYPDTCAWIFGYDQDLNFAFKPISISGEFSVVSNLCNFNNEYFLLSRTKQFGKTERKILFFNKRGVVTDTVQIKDNGFTNLISFMIKKKEHFFLFKAQNGIYMYKEFDPAVKKLFHSSVSKKINYLMRQKNPYDIDKDSEPEFIFSDKTNNNYYLYRNNLKDRVKIPVKENTDYIYYVSSKKEGEKIRLIFLSPEYVYYCTYYENPNYLLKYPFWAAVFIISFVFVRLIQNQQSRRIKKQDELKNKIINLQLKNTQNQLDPHFTFNALNVVASKIYKEDRKTAYDLFERFSRLMRSSLAFSDKIFRPLNDELQFTEDYLEFQKTRFKNLFDFEIKISENIDTRKINVPKMIVQGFAENCVKHAFKNIDYKGKINIEVKKQAEKILIKIEDNGIGIKQSQINNPVPKSGVGMIAVQEQINLINQLYNKEIVIAVKDKSSISANLSGTTILIQL